MVKTVIYILPYLKKIQNLETFVKFAACVPDVAPEGDPGKNHFIKSYFYLL